MGTNFYHQEKGPCETCSREYESRHIGKSSAGWCFSLHVYPHDGIKTLSDWESRFSHGTIVDEYGTTVTPEEMVERITARSFPRKRPEDRHWYETNHAQPGPNGLARHRIDGRHCIGHGEGTWDYIVGEFS